MDLRRNAYVPVFIEERLIESRSIVRIYDRDTFLNLARHIGRRIHRQITAFGMAADHNRPGPMVSQLGQITRGGLLRGDRAAERHHEVLFPPDDRAVGTAKSHIERAVTQFEHAGRELLGGFGIEFVHVCAYA